MFEFFAEKHDCPNCSTKIAPSKIRVSRSRSIKVFTCPNCKADYIKNKRAELFPVLEEGIVLC